MAIRGGREALDAWLDESRAWAERLLDRALPALDDAGPLREAMRYAVLGGGKRLRPALVRLMCNGIGGCDADCEMPAVAVELVHAYTLVHDDLPCMDDDDYRRGRPSCHRVFGEAIALLAGDALQAKAFRLLCNGSESKAVAWVRTLASAIAEDGLVEGQALDMALSGSPLTREAIAKMHRLKTGSLIGAAAEMGCEAGGGEAVAREAREFGIALGACFQAVDDLLDRTGDRETLGKTPGKDERDRKPTMVRAMGVEGARREIQRLSEVARVQLSALPIVNRDLASSLIEWVSTRQT